MEDGEGQEAPLLALQREGKYWDCVVAAQPAEEGDLCWRCHRVVLAARSPFFAAALSPDPEGGEGDEDAPRQRQRVVLPFPQRCAAAFAEIIPHLYDGRIGTDFNVENAVALLVLAVCLGVQGLAGRLRSALEELCPDQIACTALLGALCSPWLEGLAAVAQRAAGLHPLAAAEAMRGAGAARGLISELRDLCAGALVPRLASLLQPGAGLDSLPPEGLLSVLRHPRLGSECDDSVASAVVSRFLLSHESAAAGGAARHQHLTQEAFSQLAGHCRKVPAGDVSALLRAALRRREPRLVRTCIRAAHDAFDKVSGLDGELMEVFAASAAGRLQPAPGDDSQPSADSVFSSPGGADGAADAAPGPAEPPAAKRRRGSEAAEGSPQRAEAGASRPPPPDTPLTCASDALFASCAPDGPGASAPAQRWRRSRARGGAADGDLTQVTQVLASDAAEEAPSQQPPDDDRDPEPGAEEEEEDDEGGVEMLRHALSQASQSQGVHSVLGKLQEALATHRKRRRDEASDAIREAMRASTLSSQLVVRHCSAAWAEAAQGCEGAATQLRAQLEATVQRTQAAEQEVAEVRARAEAAAGEIDSLRKQCAALSSSMELLRTHSRQQMAAAAEANTNLVAALRDDLSGRARALEQRLSAVADRNSGALRRLSSLLAKELTAD
eukprot:TRINITY_DN60285_c0_g1_i1.p1 TRINITY_DN60285_c0_g1~~TRINITY_DN60285_c0_g1_i1.p1  ORF type:complete len:695 (+),score=246.79 TRINITY_DN60285_c0_g1_i1:80-2086(+)